MYQSFLFNASFHELLFSIDQEIANKVCDKGSPCCQAKLHRGDYPRSPMGLPPQLREPYKYRLSFCCSVCRKRVTPPSVRFFGYRWFIAPIFLLISILQCGISKFRLKQVQRYFGVNISESTWRSWRQWWNDRFHKLPFWLSQGRTPPTSKSVHNNISRSLLNEFTGEFLERFISMLKFLSPLTTKMMLVI